MSLELCKCPNHSITRSEENTLSSPETSSGGKAEFSRRAKGNVLAFSNISLFQWTSNNAHPCQSLVKEGDLNNQDQEHNAKVDRREENCFR